jgi:hypothetical protein
MRSKVSVIGAGAQAVTITPPAGSRASIFTLPVGRLDYAHICNLKLVSNGETPTDTDECHGIYFEAQMSGPNGGWWRSSIDNVDIHDFEGSGIWFRGHTYLGDIFQFNTLRNVSVYNYNSVNPGSALRLSGRCGQFEFIDCRFDGTGKGTGPDYVVRVERERNAADTGYTANAGNYPYVINFRGCSFQLGVTGILIDRLQAGVLDGCYWEQSSNGVLVSTTNRGVSVVRSTFANINDGGGTGYCIKADVNSRVRSAGNAFVGTIDQHYVASNDGAVIVEVDDYDTGVTLPSSSGLVPSLTAAATVSMLYQRNVRVPASATSIQTINANAAPGERVTFRASGGTIQFTQGGNISFGYNHDPLVIQAEEEAVFQWDDHLSRWYLISVTPRGLGVATPAALAAGNNNDYHVQYSGTWRLTPDATGSTITGIANGFSQRRLRIINIGAATLSLTNLDAASAAVNRIITNTGATINLATNEIAELEYDSTSVRWRAWKP